MWVNITQAFTKITAWPVQKLCFRTKIHYRDKSIQGRRIKGPAILICNHTSVYDFAVLMFVFFSRTLRCQVAEVIFRKPVLGVFIKLLGGIKVDRGTHDFVFLEESARILRDGGVVEIYPESRIPRKGEARPLPLKPSAAYLALRENVPIIPVYTNGSYFAKKRARVVIGTPIHPFEIAKEELSDKENIEAVNALLRERLIALKELLYEQTNRKKEEKTV